MQDNTYSKLIEHIFLSKYQPGAEQVEFEREDLLETAKHLHIALPKNLGDVIYSFRYRNPLPQTIQAAAPPGKVWRIRSIGRGRYRFEAVQHKKESLTPNLALTVTKVPDATPGLVTRYALDDEQALLAQIRYNRLIDLFTGLTCYPLQSHLRTTVKGIGQIETDELYIGVDKRGAHYVLPVQVKVGKARISLVQIEQDAAMCAEKFPSLICRPVAAHYFGPAQIALFLFSVSVDGVDLAEERHYQLVEPDQVTEADLKQYVQSVNE